MTGRPPLIGITTYHRDKKGYITLPGQYADAVRRAGGLPLLIQPGETAIEALLETLDAIVLSGGGDVDPACYSAAPHELLHWVDQERDGFEIELARRTVDRGMPLLCICRGMQLLNVARGGTLIQHLPDEVGGTVRHTQPPRDATEHRVDVAPDSRLAKIMGAETVTTASWHHQALDVLGADLHVVARAADGVVEAVEIRGNEHVTAVQWHPELTAEVDATQQRLFDDLVEQARAASTKVSG